VEAGEDTIELPNGLTCYLTSKPMRPMAGALAKEIFDRRCYAPPGFELRATDTVVDIGANLGLFALWAAPQAAHIISVEPAPRAIECLKLNIERNRVQNVTVVEKAVARNGGVLEMVTHPGWEGLSHTVGQPQPFFIRLLTSGVRKRNEEQDGERFSVPKVSLPRLLDDCGLSRVNYLKIDCEGGEYEILRSMGAAHWQRIDKVVMEFHDFVSSNRHRELVAILRNNGFEVEVDRNWIEYSLSKTGQIRATRR
jgi:FkbM family methyltransferase